MNDVVKLVQILSITVIPFSVCVNTQRSYEKTLKYNFVAGELRIALCISKKDAKEKMKNNVAVRLSSWEHPSLHRRGKKQWEAYQRLRFIL